MKKFIFGSLCLVVIILAVALFYWFNKTSLFNFFSPKQTLLNPIIKNIPKPKPLLDYTFDNLKATKFPTTQISVGQMVNETPDSYSQMFYFSVPEKPSSTVMKKVSGLLNLPKKPGIYPVIVMIRGYVPKETYQPGYGTQPSAKVFSQNGLITLAPDFLGYGESDNPSDNGFEDRFQTYVTTLTLLSSLSTLNSGLEASYSGKIKADTTKIGLWGHSNGGHIALSTLAISGQPYPTVLWAPVSKSFPYSILYYTDDTDDEGKALRLALAHFEEDYDSELFSPINFYQWIKAPLEIHQGTADQEVPVWWSDNLVKTLKKDGVNVTYLTYPGADHNLRPNGWSGAVFRSLDFFINKLK